MFYLIAALAAAFVIIHGHAILDGFPDRRVRAWYRRLVGRILG